MWACFAFVLAGMFGLVEILLIPVQFGFVIVFGWVGFLWRTVPLLGVDWPAVGWCSAVALLVLGGTHWLGRSLAGASWKLRRTLLLHAGIAVLLLAAVGMTGTAHQAAWLATSDRAWVTSGPRSRSAQTQAQHDSRRMDFLLEVGRSDGLPPGTWSLPHDLPDLRKRNSILRFPDDQTVPGVVVMIPRDASVVARLGFTFWPTNGPFRTRPAARLESTIQELQKKR